MTDRHRISPTPEDAEIIARRVTRVMKAVQASPSADVKAIRRALDDYFELSPVRKS